MTTNVRNVGIAHLAYRAGGQPLCGSRRAHIVAAAADKDRWPRICARCQAKLASRPRVITDARTGAPVTREQVAQRFEGKPAND